MQILIYALSVSRSCSAPTLLSAGHRSLFTHADKVPITAIFRDPLPQGRSLQCPVDAKSLLSIGHSLIPALHEQHIPSTEKFP